MPANICMLRNTDKRLGHFNLFRCHNFLVKKVLLPYPAGSPMLSINDQDPQHSTPETWTSQQILDFTMLPKINDAFAKPLYIIDMQPEHLEASTSQSQATDNNDWHALSDSEQSLMDISSESASSSASDASFESFVSVD